MRKSIKEEYYSSKQISGRRQRAHCNERQSGIEQHGMLETHKHGIRELN